MGDEIGHECGFALLRLLKPPEHFLEKYGSHFYGVNRMYMMMEKQRNRGQDGAGIASVKLDVPPGVKYINCEKSIASDPIRDVFERVTKQGTERLKKAPSSAKTPLVDGSDTVDPRWVKEHVPFCGEAFLAHVRYGTDSDNSLDRCHPVTRESNWMTRNLILAGNFNITNNEDLFASLVQLGQHPRELSDTVMLLERIGHFVDKENNDLYVKYSSAGNDHRASFDLIADNLNIARILRRASCDLDGGYCIAGLFGHGDSFVMRDPSGIRPAFYYADDEIITVASEAAVIQTVFAVREENVHAVPPGHALCIRRAGTWSLEKILEPQALKQCSFERIYFSRGNDAGIYRERGQLGRLLFRPLLQLLDRSGNNLSNTVLSFIPNTSELAFYGLVKEAQSYLDKQRLAAVQKLAQDVNRSSDQIPPELESLLSATVRMEKVVGKDAKIRTFIQEDSSREQLTVHAYDVHYGTIRRDKDIVVALDDSIVRGNTLRNAILRTLDRMGPTKIIMVSSAPQIRFPDVYGIDMAKLGDLAAFKAAIGLIRQRNLDHVLVEVYRSCKIELDRSVQSGKIINHVRKIYEPFTPEEIAEQIAKDVKPKGCNADVEILFQTVEDLHHAMPNYLGDWYFTGNYPTQGGAKVCCRAFVLWMEGSTERCYGINSVMSRSQRPILVLGSGGREHALAWKLSKSSDVSCVYVAPGNGGLGPLNEHSGCLGSRLLAAVDLKLDAPEFDHIVSFCREHDVRLVVVGPEHLLAQGIVDKLTAQGIAAFGPTKAAAEIESSKSWAKAFMQRHRIPTAEYSTFHGPAELEAALSFAKKATYPIVVKASGLCAGKGVVIPADATEVEHTIRAFMEHDKLGEAGREIVLERKLEGVECSILALTDGTQIAVLPAAQDHKRAHDGEQGPNTGGMGAFAPADAVTPKMLEQIKSEVLCPAIKGLKAEGRPFIGCLFAGLILTSEGPKVLEFNCRFGDPEAQAILPLLDCDLSEVLMSCVRGQLTVDSVQVSPQMNAVTVVMASEGYPGSYEVGKKITGLERAACVPGVTVFHAGTRSVVRGSLSTGTTSLRSPLNMLLKRSQSFGSMTPAVVTSGGRVLAVTAVGRCLSQARERAYVAARSIQFEGTFYRSDIALPMPGTDRRVSESYVNTSKQSPTYLSAGVDLQMDEAIRAKIEPLLHKVNHQYDNLAVSDSISSSSILSAGLCGAPDFGAGKSVLVSSTNVVGTKVKVASCMEQYYALGVDLVALCANDIASRGAVPLLFMNHLATAKLDMQQAVQISQGVADGCNEANCSFVEAKTAEMPGVFHQCSFDLTGFSVGVAEQDKLLPKHSLMKPGDVLIGLHSSGLHCNGFSLVRSAVQEAGMKYHAAAPFDPTQSFGAALLTSTRVYVHALLKLVGMGKLKGAAPVVNGGLSMSIPRMLPQQLQAHLRASSWELPPIFRWLAGSLRISCREMAATFNCGIGMVLVVSKDDVEIVMETLKEMHEQPCVIGELVEYQDHHEAVHIEGAETSWLMLPELGVSLPFPQVLSSLQDPCTVTQVKALVLAGSASVTPLEALLDAADARSYPARIAAVVSTDKNSNALPCARARCIDAYVIEDKDTNSGDPSSHSREPGMLKNNVGANLRQVSDIHSLICATEAQVLIILDDVDTSCLSTNPLMAWDGTCITVHAALVPQYGGLSPIEAALNDGLSITGCTIFSHKFKRAKGQQRIIAQESTRILPEDTAATLHARVVLECESRALPEALRKVAVEIDDTDRKCYSKQVNVADRESSTDPVNEPPSEKQCVDGDARRYDQRGVSANKGDVHAAIKDMDKGLFPSAFCKVVPDHLSNDEAHAIVMHADGAGTKSSLAYMYWRKTGDLSVWKGIAQDALVMNLDDMLCVGVTSNIMLSSTIGRNKNLIPGEVIGAIIRGTQELVNELDQHGVSIALTGGETADVGDLVRTVIVDSTVTARILKSHIIDNGNICAGNVIVGLASSGRATYEAAYNSGIGSNGLTAARHDTFEKSLAQEFPESFDPSMPSNLVYTGQVALEQSISDDDVVGEPVTAGKLVLSPTRTYAPIVSKIFASGLRDKINGMVHCSGGGQTKVLHFVNDLHVVKNNLMKTPPVFKLIQQNSGTPWEEMYKVFNMGHRLEFYTDELSAQEIIRISKTFNVDAQIIGRVEATTLGKKHLTINSEHGTFKYLA